MNKMRHQSNSRRHRNRGNNGRRNGPPRMQVFDSNGPDVRIRGTAHQVCEKYLTLAKDAASAGDRILAESYLQHAEHYQRIITKFESENPAYSDTRFDQRVEASNGVSAADDLSLPASILGGAPKVESAARTPEAVGAE